MSDFYKHIDCNDVNIQTYECAYHIYLPWLCKSWEDNNKKEMKMVSIDKCLLPEIISLWEQGIKTTGCCCGHGDPSLAFIGVRLNSEDIQKMKDLGYEVQYNPCRPDDEDSFVPKTKLVYEESKCTEV